MNRGALDLLEESVELLKNAGSRALLQYLIGVTPFLFALLALVRHMTVFWGGSHLLMDSLLCAAAFLWMSSWKSRFAGTLSQTLLPDHATGSSSDWLTVITTQGIVQSAKLFVLPLAIVSVLPLPWVSAFFRSVAVEANRPDVRFSHAIARAARFASAQAHANWPAILTLAALELVVFVNIAILLFALPQLFKVFTGYENDWTRNPTGAVGVNMLAIAAAVTWFLIDPVIQAFAVLRIFYLEARSDGRDLLLALRRIAVFPLVLLACGIVAPQARAASPSPSREDLDGSIHQILQADEYGWQRPQTERVANGFWGALADRVDQDFAAARKQIHAWLRPLRDWLRDALESHPTQETPQARAPARELRLLIYVLAGVLALALLFAVLRRLRKSIPSEASAAAPAASADVHNDQLLPSDIPEEEWLRLAQDYLAKGDSRLAARALYLSNLSFLGTRHLLALSKAKSNRLYERELARSPHSESILKAFATANHYYELAWYGLRDLLPDQLDTLQQQVTLIRQHA